MWSSCRRYPLPRRIWDQAGARKPGPASRRLNETNMLALNLGAFEYPASPWQKATRRRPSWTAVFPASPPDRQPRDVVPIDLDPGPKLVRTGIGRLDSTPQNRSGKEVARRSAELPSRTVPEDGRSTASKGSRTPKYQNSYRMPPPGHTFASMPRPTTLRRGANRVTVVL